MYENYIWWIIGLPMGFLLIGFVYFLIDTKINPEKWERAAEQRGLQLLYDHRDIVSGKKYTVYKRGDGKYVIYSSYPPYYSRLYGVQRINFKHEIFDKIPNKYKNR